MKYSYKGLVICVAFLLTHALTICQYLNRALHFCRHHEHGAMSIYESEQIIIRNCTFYNNTSDGYFTDKPYLGSSGGLSISYNSSGSCGFMPPSHIMLHVHIINCTFTDNSALLLDGQSFSSTKEILNKISYGRGGAVSILISVRDPLKLVFSGNTVINNSADTFGGGVYCLIQACANQNYTFGNNTFKKNTASVAGGMAFIYQYISIQSQFTIYNLVYNCKFYYNAARHEVAGAMGIYSVFGLANNSYITIDQCKFVNNTAVSYGGAVDIESYDFFVNIQAIPLINFTNWLVFIIIL